VNKLTKVGWAQATVVFGVVLALSLSAVAVLWLLWGAVVPFFWPTGPLEIIDPPYWSFVGALVLVKLLVSAVGLKK